MRAPHGRTGSEPQMRTPGSPRCLRCAAVPVRSPSPPRGAASNRVGFHPRLVAPGLAPTRALADLNSGIGARSHRAANRKELLREAVSSWRLGASSVEERFLNKIRCGSNWIMFSGGLCPFEGRLSNETRCGTNWVRQNRLNRPRSTFSENPRVVSAERLCRAS